MNISTFSKVTAAAFCLLLGSITYAVFQTSTLQNKVSQAYQQKDLSVQLLNQLQQNTEDLTRLARSFFNSGNIAYKDNYLKLVSVLDGKLAKPLFYPSTFWHYLKSYDADTVVNSSMNRSQSILISQIKLDAKESSYFKTFKEYSAQLRTLEQGAILLKENQHLEKGTQNIVNPLYSAQYQTIIEQTMDSIEILKQSVGDKIDLDIRSIENELLLITQVCVGLSIFTLSLFVLLFLQFWLPALRQLTTIKQEAESIAKGDYANRCSLESENELGVVSQSINVLANAFEMDLKRMQKLATTDEVTGLKNRRILLKILNHESKRATRYEHPLAIILIHIDSFREINNTYGSEMGDMALKMVGLTCQRAQRETDNLGRYGSAEFISVLPVTDQEGSLQVAQRIISDIKKINFTHENKKIEIAVSIGITQLFANEQIDAMVARANQAMLQSQRKGSNQITTAQ